MNDTYIVTLYVIVEDVLKLMRYTDDGWVQVKAAERPSEKAKIHLTHPSP